MAQTRFDIGVSTSEDVSRKDAHGPTVLLRRLCHLWRSSK